ncbi:DUF4357 domain-containing protein [Streptococcaceae bacterium ESL0687]|nr:DUF4357 domain-containing protein [Streptococcaceae bacterium ESL0687]
MNKDLSKDKDIEEQVFYLKARGADAEAVFVPTSEEMMVLEGSHRTPKPTSASFTKYDLLDQLIEVGTINEAGLFLKDFTFNSPSEAAEIVAGSPYDGPKEWKDQSGRSLEDFLD